MSTRPRVVVTCALPGGALDLLRARADVVVTSEAGGTPPEVLASAVKDADGLLSVLTDQVTRELLESAPRLRVVGTCAVGYDNVDVAAATALGIQVCNTPSVLTEATADLAWALLMATARRLGEADRHVRSGAFQRWELGLLLGKSVHGSTLGILGCGRIGQAVARRARGFDMAVLYAQRHRLPEKHERALGARHVPLATLLEQSDFVSVHLPLTPETHHLLDAAALARMKPDAVLVNTARGPIIDEAALAAALAGDHLAGAGLDVFEHEPRVHPGLLASSRVVLAPHIGSATSSTRIAMAEAVAADVLRVLDGGAPANGVNAPARRR